MHFIISDLQDDLNQSLDANQFEVINFNLGLECGDDLTILFIHMNKEAFKAAVDRICEEAEVELQQRVKENQLKAII